MALVKAVVDKVNTSGVVTSTRDEEISTSTVTRWGKRTVDEGVFKFSINTDIDENDNLRYIQDIVPVDLLIFIHNFQLTTFDEGGYNHNPATDLSESRFVNPNGISNTKKFQSQYILSFDQSGTEAYDLQSDPRIDLSGQFDIYVWCQFSPSLGTYTTGDNAWIWTCRTDLDNEDIALGFEETAGGDKILAVRINNGVSTTVHTGSTNNRFLSDTPRLIRVKRDENDDIKCYLNGALEITISNEPVDFGGNIKYGSHPVVTSSDKWGGHIMQDRLYVGSYLTDEEADIILLHSPQPMTMKLSGKVWSVDDNTNPKVVKVKGNSKIFTETKINPDILSGTDTTPNRTKNVYDAGDDNFEIIADILENVDSSFTLKDPNSAPNASHIGKFVATGSFAQCIDLLLLESDAILFTHNKNVIIEDASGITTPFKFEQGSSSTTPGVVITNTGKDDSVLVNQLEMVGRTRFKHRIQQFVTSSNPETVSLTADRKPVNLRIVRVSDGAILEEDTDYTVGFEAGEITFNVAADTFDVEYDYEDLESSSALYFRNTTTGSGSVTQYGKYDRRIFVPQLTDQGDINEASQRIIGDNNTVLQRYEVKSPNHVNHLRENHNINLVNSIKSINTTETLQSITWTYPEMRTVMQFGEYRFDSFDLEKIDIDSSQSGTANTFKTHNV